MFKKSITAVAVVVSVLQVGATFTTKVLAEEHPYEMHRLYNPNSGEHFYTKDNQESAHLQSVGWRYEGIGWYAPETSNTPVYRLYNANAGDHHYTISKEEKDNLVSVGWKYEGIGWYSDDTKGVSLYRQYNPNAKAGSHNYTTSKTENDHLVSVGWKEEGLAWYGKKGHYEVKVIKEAWDETITKPAWDEPIYEKVEFGTEIYQSSWWYRGEGDDRKLVWEEGNVDTGILKWRLGKTLEESQQNYSKAEEIFIEKWHQLHGGTGNYKSGDSVFENVQVGTKHHEATTETVHHEAETSKVWVNE